jgi:hypothetical protein
MFYALIDKNNNKCIQVTDTLPVVLNEEFIIITTENYDCLYKIWDGVNFIEDKHFYKNTQLDIIKNNQLTIMEAMADQHEENLENQIVQMDVLATIYETQLESQEGSV